MSKKNIFQRIFAGAKQKSISILSSSNFSMMNGLEDSYDALNLRSFRESLYLFIGVSMIRETVSSIPLEMYRIVNKDGDSEEVHDDPFLTLLSQPNYRQTQKEFWKLAIAYYLLAGETFWYLERDNAGMPTTMVNLRPDYVRILMSADNLTIVGYEFIQGNGKIINLRVEDVLHIKNIDPVNPARGVGVVRPATQRIVTEKEASKHQSNTFKSQGRPDIAVFTEVDLTDEQTTEAREKWNKIYGNNGSNAGFFGADVKSVQLLGVNPKEMDFINTQKFLRDDILASLHIPKAMITSDDVNLANSRTARINYIKEACLPILDTFIDIINNKLLLDMGEDKFLAYENPVIEDRDMILKETVELKQAGIITTNEARDLMSYPAIDGGDQLSTNTMGQLQLSMKKIALKKKAKRILNKRVVLRKKLVAVEALTKLYAQEKEVARARNSVFATKEAKELYIKAFNKNVDNKARHFKDTIDVYNRDLEKRILKHMEDFGVGAEHIFNATTEIVEAKKIFVPLMKNMYDKIGQEALDHVANGFSSTKASENFYTPEAMLQALEARSEFFILSMLDTDYNELKKLITQGLQQGKGVDEIGRDIRGYFDNMSVARAKTIARTETGRLVSSATNEAYKQSALVTGKEWMTAGDSKVRDEHVMNDGVIVDTEGVFPNGEHYPAEHSINCRCAIAPAI